jgi:RNA polymerase sigma-70 factor (ECF subfamily)
MITPVAIAHIGAGGSAHVMTNETIAGPRPLKDTAVMQRFLDARSEATFAELFRLFSPKLVAFFRARGCTLIAEDLTQEVMLTVYRKAGQLRDHGLFRAWVFRIARNAVSRHFSKRTREVNTVDLSDVPEGLARISPGNGGAAAFEFNDWMDFLDDREKEVLTLRYVEEWEYHEIAAARNIPIGTVQWRVFNAKRKLAPLLSRAKAPETSTRYFELKAA